MNLTQDIRYGLRMLLRAPGFAVVAVLTLAVGIGANTAMFSLVDQVLWNTVPYPEADRLVHIDWSSKSGTYDQVLNAPQTQFVIDRNRSFESVAVTFGGAGCNLVSGARPEYVSAETVSPGFFHTMQVSPLIGREFVTDDVDGTAVGGLARANPARAAILSYGLWRRMFSADRNVIGTKIHCNGNPLTVVGVLPADFRHSELADIYFPDVITAHLRDTGGNYEVTARLKNGLSLKQARREMDELAREYVQGGFDDSSGRKSKYPAPPTFGLTPLGEWLTGSDRKPLLLLFAAVGLVLLMACANIAGLMLARSSARRRELALRAAIGARRSRIFAQLLTESLVLNLVGGAAGLLLAWWATRATNWYVAEHYPIAGHIGINALVLFFALGASLFSGLLTGTAPALHSSRADLGGMLKQGEHGSASAAQQRIRKLLVIGEVAVAVVLVIGGALLVRSFARLRGVPLGFSTQNVEVAEFSLASKRYLQTAAVARFSRELIERLSATPGVAAVASTTSTPMHRDLNMYNPEVCERAVQYRGVSPGYFAALSSPILRGREFVASDTAPVAIVNESFVRRCSKGRDLLGAVVPGLGNDVPREIVGIVADTHEWGVARPAWPTMWVPQDQIADGTNHLAISFFHWSVVVRTRAKVDVARAVDSAVQQIDPQQPVISVKPLSELVSRSLQTSRLSTQLVGAFAAIALLLTAIGLYGLLTFHVTQRTREIGIRMALGAAASDVLGMVAREGLLLVIIGMAVGLGGAFAATRLLRNLLFGVGATDPGAFAVSLVFLLVVSGLAIILPARKAAGVDPVIALRCE